MQKTLSEHFHAQLQRQTLERLEEEAAFEYPLGTNFSYQVFKDRPVE